MSTNTALDQIKNRVEGHTEGPWEAITSGPSRGDHWYVCANDEAIAHISANDGYDEEQRGPNAELMAAAPKLLAALEAVEEAVAALDARSREVRSGDDNERGFNMALKSASYLLREAIEEALR